MYRLFIKYTQALDSSDGRTLQQKLELMLDKEKTPVAVITNMVDCFISVQWHDPDRFDIMQTNRRIHGIQLVLSCLT
jgi:hypothetical protein